MIATSDQEGGYPQTVVEDLQRKIHGICQVRKDGIENPRATDQGS